jgi:hypothetical protein
MYSSMPKKVYCDLSSEAEVRGGYYGMLGKTALRKLLTRNEGYVKADLYRLLPITSNTFLYIKHLCGAPVADAASLCNVQ